MARVCVALSGGVDSSVAAALLLDAGHEVTGITARLRDGEAGDEVMAAARAVADHLGISHEELDLRDRFERDVIHEFCAGYAAGRTPNPCVTCNSVVKFGALLEAAVTMGCERFATGHYARVGSFGGTRVIARAADREKDQSYFLHALAPDALSRAVFPLGGLSKAVVRREAAARGIPAAERPESQDVCFVAPEARATLVVAYRPEAGSPGRIVDAAGTVLGEHAGIAGFTVGQRKGLGIRDGAGPYYVTAVDADTARIVVGGVRDLERTVVEAVGGWSIVPDLTEVDAVIRYRMTPLRGTVELEGERLRVRFEMPVVAVAEGQSVVCYVDDRIVAGGEITCAS